MRPSNFLWVLAWSALISSAAFGQSPNNGAAVGAATGVQSAARTVSDGAGGAFFAWLDARFNGNRVYMQRLDASGTAQWTVNGIPLSPANQGASALDLVSDGAGGAIVVWIDPRAGDNDVYAQRVNASGTPQWTADGVLVGGVGAHALVARSDGAGGALAVWQDFRVGGASLALFVQRLNAGGVPQWTVDGVHVVTGPSEQFSLSPTMVSDGGGGAIVAWADARDENPFFGGDIYARRVNGTGVVQWAAGGVPLAVVAGSQLLPAAAADGAGGAIVAWQDGRGSTRAIFAQRVNAAGAVQWDANGVSVASGYTQEAPAIAGDGAAGAIVAWRETFNGSSYDTRVQRLSGAGSRLWGGGVTVSTGGGMGFPALLAEAGAAIVTWTVTTAPGNRDLFGQRLDLVPNPTWAPAGVAISAAPGDQDAQAMATDGSGGLIAAWQDFRLGANADIFAQRVSAAGVPGFGDFEAPRLRDVVDVPNDEGGRVQLTWDASPLDAPALGDIDSYWIWREAPPAIVAGVMRLGIAPSKSFAAGTLPRIGELWSTTYGTAQYFWEFIGSQPAGHFPGYSFVAPTTSDSTAESNPLTAFLVQARATDGRWWDSNPDSGYSVDDLAPATPGPLTGEYAGGATTLSWEPNVEIDLAGYRLHRGTSAGFVPGPGNLIATPGEPGWVDDAGQPYFYKLSAIDVHGNESGFALLEPAITTGVEDRAAAGLWLAAGIPNPMLSHSLLRFAVPRDARVSLTIHDLSGREVRRLVGGMLPAGEHAARWDGRDGEGRDAASGMYLVRLETEGTTRASRLVKVR